MSRHRQRTEEGRRKGKERKANEDSNCDVLGEGDDDKTEKRPQGDTSSNDNQLVGILLMVLVAVLIGIAIYRQVGKPVMKEDDIPTLDGYLDDDNDQNKYSNVEDDLPDAEEKTTNVKQGMSTGEDDQDADYEDIDERPPDYEDIGERPPGGDGYNDLDGSQSRGGGYGDIDMEPTDPMEEQFPFGNEHMQQMPDHNSFMRPHMGPKVDYWKDVMGQLKGEERVEILHKNPDIVVVPDFLTTAECMQMIQLHESMALKHADPPTWCFVDEEWLASMLAKENLTSKAKVFTLNDDLHKSRACVKGLDVHHRLSQELPYSTSSLVPRGENKLVDTVEWRLEDDYGLPRDHAYHTQFVKYRAGEKYNHHHDCSTSGELSANERLATVIIYLSDVKEGGETVFAELDIKVKPKRGTALFFKNLDSKGKCNKRTLHAGAPPQTGVKYIYQHWYHERIIIPTYTHDYVLCDGSFSCREYIHSPETRMATKLLRQGEEARPNIKKALEFYKKAVQTQPNHAAALLYAGDSLAQQRQGREALKYFERHLKLHPKSIDANFIAAGLYQDKGDRAKAIKLLTQVVLISPQDTDALFNLGALYHDTKQHVKAASALKTLVALNPKDGEAHALLAEALEKLGDIEGARKHRKEGKQHRSRSQQ